MNQHHEDAAQPPEPEGFASRQAGTSEQDMDEMDDIVAALLTLADEQRIASGVSVPLRSLAGRWREPYVRVAVLGEVSVGKSTLVNALLDRRLLPDAVQALSSVPVELSHGPELRGTVTLYEGIREEIVERGLSGEQEVNVYLTSTGERVVAQRHGRGTQVLRAEVRLPAALLAGGLRLVDTPGVGGADPAHRRLALAALSDADAVLFVVRSGEPLSASEQAFLGQAAQRVDHVAVVQTQSDLVDDAGRRLDDDLARLSTASGWTEVCDADEAGRIAALMGSVTGVSVSARLALHAQDAPPGPQREEDLAMSGLPRLETWLRSEVVERVEEIHRRDVLRLTESTALAVRRRIEQSQEVLHGDEEAERAVEERERRIADWERTDGDSWRTHLAAALTSLAEDLPRQAAELVATLRTEYRDRFEGMSRAERKEAVKTLPRQPQVALDEMVTTVQERLREAVRRIAERDGKGLVAEHLERLGDSATVSVRVPKRAKMSDAAMEQMANAFVMAKAALFRARAQRQEGAEREAAGADGSTQPSRADHGTTGSEGATVPAEADRSGEPDGRTTVRAALTSLTMGTIREIFARRAAEREQMVTLFDRVAKAITEEAVALALKEAKGGCEAVTTVIDDLLAEQRQEVEQDREDLRLALDLSPAERAERVADTELCLRELDELASRMAAVRERWAL
ncbi:dynamin family protein [Streptomyces sp. HNA39]|uniref:dynamin family protein n=1 Tax=Streptomyces sp. HNA39 TaxID=2850561 RepID=UPI00200D7234|nr:dynamin family protein [Streptomyces sp. HNA39]UQA32350.1 dynamin family protein [Streptomyces sp. HNA39]